MNTSMSYTDMENFYPIQVIDLLFRIGQLKPRKSNNLKNLKLIWLMYHYFNYYSNIELIVIMVA